MRRQRRCEDHRSLLDETGISLLLEGPASPLWVEGDPTRLAQIVGNLLQNAAKFSDPGGQVTIQLAAEPPAWITLSVRDTGIGIAPEALPRVFEPLFQADCSLSRSRGGLGLGLALVKGLVELHGGEVSAHSPGPGEGTEIIIRLPRVSGPDTRQEVSLPASLVARPGRILIIEDNALSLAALRKMLAQWGHEVVVAHTGPEGVAAARRFRPEVVLCDLGLPEMDGCAVARELRQDPTTRPAWLIAATGYGAEADRRRSLDAGFDRHLVKPVAAVDLRQLLAELLGS
jgi:CheY-like chemotaxis protein